MTGAIKGISAAEPVARVERPGSLRVEAWYLVPLAALAAVYLATVLPHLGDDPIVGGDEGWIISASAKLAETGAFGSDLFRGFYGAEDHYYFNLPLQHLLLAGVFKVFGTGVIQGRLVSVLFGLAALALTYALGRRLGGPLVGLMSAALIVLLRLNLAPFSGLTLTDLGATVRYDLIAVPFGLGAVLLLLGSSPANTIDPEAPGAYRRAGAAGLLLGFGCLTQFLAAFLVLPIAAYLLTLGGPPRRRLTVVAVFGVALLLPFIPYRVYIGQHSEDFRGQARSVEQRTDFLSPSFYWRQIRDEPERYKLSTGLQELPASLGDALSRPSARLAILLVGPAALIYTLARGRRDADRRLVGLVFVLVLAEVALFESTKRFVYWVIAVPFLCVATADFAVALWRWRPSAGATMWAARAAVVAVLGLFAVEGLAVAAKDVRDAGDAPSYAELGRRLEGALPEDATLLGDNRVWPALREHELRSLLLLFYHTNPRISRERTTDVFGAMERIDADYVLISPLSLEILSKLSPRDRADFDRFMATRTESVETIEYETYGPLQVFRVRR